MLQRGTVALSGWRWARAGQNRSSSLLTELVAASRRIEPHGTGRDAELHCGMPRGISGSPHQSRDVAHRRVDALDTRLPRLRGGGDAAHLDRSVRVPDHVAEFRVLGLSEHGTHAGRDLEWE